MEKTKDPKLTSMSHHKQYGDNLTATNKYK